MAAAIPSMRPSTGPPHARLLLPMTRRQDSVSFYRAARALRPDSAAVLMHLGFELFAAGDRLAQHLVK